MVFAIFDYEAVIPKGVTDDRSNVLFEESSNIREHRLSFNWALLIERDPGICQQESCHGEGSYVIRPWSGVPVCAKSGHDLFEFGMPQPPGQSPRPPNCDGPVL